MLKIIFAGTPEFAAQHLQTLLDEKQFEVCAVYTQPDRRKGRGKKTMPTPVKEIALAANIPVHQPTTLRNADEQKILNDYQADVMVVVAYGLILPKEILDAPRLGCINVHGSILPRWRGAAPIERAIEAGDATTGITIMQMDIGLDDGPMLLKETINIETQDTGDSLREKLANIGCNLLLKTLHSISKTTLAVEIQNHEQANYAHKLNKQEAHINWHTGANIIERKIRAFISHNVCFGVLHIEDKNNSQIRIKVWESEVLEQSSEKSPGTIIQASKEGIDVCTQDKVLRLKKLQVPGGKVLAVADILNGRAAWFEPNTQFISPETITPNNTTG